MIREHQNPELKDAKKKNDQLDHLKTFLDN